jgi:hypothetical protein
MHQVLFSIIVILTTITNDVKGGGFSMGGGLLMTIKQPTGIRFPPCSEFVDNKLPPSVTCEVAPPTWADNKLPDGVTCEVASATKEQGVKDKPKHQRNKLQYTRNRLLGDVDVQQQQHEFPSSRKRIIGFDSDTTKKQRPLTFVDEYVENALMEIGNDKSNVILVCDVVKCSRSTFHEAETLFRTEITNGILGYRFQLGIDIGCTSHAGIIYMFLRGSVGEENIKLPFQARRRNLKGVRGGTFADVITLIRNHMPNFKKNNNEHSPSGGTRDEGMVVFLTQKKQAKPKGDNDQSFHRYNEKLVVETIKAANKVEGLNGVLNAIGNLMVRSAVESELELKSQHLTTTIYKGGQIYRGDEAIDEYYNHDNGDGTTEGKGRGTQYGRIAYEITDGVKNAINEVLGFNFGEHPEISDEILTKVNDKATRELLKQLNLEVYQHNNLHKVDWKVSKRFMMIFAEELGHIAMDKAFDISELTYEHTEKGKAERLKKTKGRLLDRLISDKTHMFKDDEKRIRAFIYTVNGGIEEHRE